MTPKLIDVVSKTATSNESTFELVISVSGYEGNPEPVELPYGWRVGDHHGLGPQLDAWMAAHPNFPVGDYVAPPEPFAPLSRPAFLFMMNKIGVTEDTVEGLIAVMPEGTQEEADAKTLALIVFRNQQTFRRDNALLVQLATAAGVTSEQVDAAWRQAEQIVW